jgi:hypothetical protein
MELSYRRHQFPPLVIRHAVWLYPRFTLSYRDLENLLAERELDISYETVRSWVLKFGPVIARRLRRCRPSPERSMAPGRDDCSAASECHQIPVSPATATSDGTQCGISQIRAGRVLSAAPARFCADLAHHRGRIHFCRKALRSRRDSLYAGSAFEHEMHTATGGTLPVRLRSSWAGVLHKEYRDLEH